MKNMISITKTQFVAEWLDQWTSRNEHMMGKDASSNPTGPRCTLGVQVLTRYSCCTLMIKGKLVLFYT